MGKHQNCVGCSCDFVGPDANIGLNLCEDCEEDMHGPCREELAKAVAEIERLRDEYVRLLGAASSLASYAATCKTGNMVRWVDGLAGKINAYNEATGDSDRVRRYMNALYIEHTAKEQGEE